jgi:hypothetical protein
MYRGKRIIIKWILEKYILVMWIILKQPGYTKVLRNLFPNASHLICGVGSSQTVCGPVKEWASWFTQTRYIYHSLYPSKGNITLFYLCSLLSPVPQFMSFLPQLYTILSMLSLLFYLQSVGSRSLRKTGMQSANCTEPLPR